MKNRKHLLNLIDELTRSLRFYSEIGCRGFECSDKGLSTIRQWGQEEQKWEREPTSAAETLDDIRADIGDCRRCKLAAGRKHIVFGAGNPDAELVFVGEGPGYAEDQQGLPFVGKAGQLLTKIIQAIHFTRETVYICNIIKCRPPNNRNPEPDEIEACFPFLVRQLQVIKPRIICALGTFAAQTLLNTRQPISALRGRFHDYHGIKLMPTYHPAFLLRNPDKKRDVWEDMKKIMKEFQ